MITFIFIHFILLDLGVAALSAAALYKRYKTKNMFKDFLNTTKGE